MVKSKQGYKLYTKEEIISLVKNWYDANGNIVIRDLRHKNGLPSTTQVINVFGSFKNCLIECGIDLGNEKLFSRKKLSDEKLIHDFKCFVEEFLKSHITLPTYSDIDESNTLNSSDIYNKRFKSINNLYKLIGFDMEDFNNTAIEKDMIKKYKEQCDKNGHTLNSREIDAISQLDKRKIYASTTYILHFGSIHNLQEMCGYYKTKPGKGITKNEMIDNLKWLSEKLGRTPVQKDLILYKNIPSISMYCREFGCFKIALKEAGLKSKRIFKTKNGIICRSTYELKLAQVLESYDIKYKNEIMYNKVIPDFDRRYRFDFVININNNKYYIELFGIESNPGYDKRKKEKIEICEKYNIPLIQLYQGDIYAKTNKEIYDTLFEHIKKIDEKAA